MMREWMMMMTMMISLKSNVRMMMVMTLKMVGSNVGPNDDNDDQLS